MLQWILTMQKLVTEDFIYLSQSVLKTLSQNRITTIFDFLQEDISKLSALTKLNLPQILAIRNEIFNKYSARVVNGTTLFVKSLEKKHFVITGIASLDGMLDGGIPVGYITEFCGLADSGKTQLSLQIAINCVKYSDNTVLYIDTKGDFSAVRLQKILDASKCTHKEMALIMFKIKVVHVWTMDELVELLRNIKNKIIINIERLALIIVDSLPCLMLQHLGDENKIGLSLLNTFVNYSRYLCKELHISMICVNIQTRWVDQEVSDLEDEGEPSIATFKESANYVERRNRCLGKYWQRIPALVLMLEKSQDKNVQGKSDHLQLNVSIIKSNMNKIRQCTLNLSAVGVT